MTELEADKACSVCPWPSFPGHSTGLKVPRVERPGQARTVPRFIVKDSYTLEMLLKTGQLGVTLWIAGDMKKPCWGQKGLSGMRRLSSASAAIYSMYITQGL